jgi:CheY-like chemotaxis protein
VLVFLRDPETATPWHPAPSAHVIPDSRGWPELLERCAHRGTHATVVTYEGVDTPAIAYSYGQLAIVVIGHERANPELAATLSAIAPLLGTVLRTEQAAHVERGQVMAEVGHELREPLVPIVTAVQMLRLEGGSNRIHDILERQVSRLLSTVDTLIAAGSTTEQPKPRATSSAGDSILVVDDNCDAADLLGDLLDSLGYQVRVAHDGPAALALLPGYTPQAALLDIGLPQMDGYQLARELRERLPGIHMIAITGYGQEHDRERALAAGFAAHLVKPVSIVQVRELLDRLLHPMPRR